MQLRFNHNLHVGPDYTLFRDINAWNIRDLQRRFSVGVLLVILTYNINHVSIFHNLYVAVAATFNLSSHLLSSGQNYAII